VARVSVLGEMTASIAHEVSQPLSAIRTDTEAGLIWLNRAEPNIGEVRASIVHIAESAARAADVIARVRGMAARRSPELTQVSINSVIEDAVAFLGHELRRNDVTVSLDLAQNIPSVLADVTQLQQVVVNLAMNAVQAMAQTDTGLRQLTVRSCRQDSLVIVMLDDTGPGIASENLHRVFESFFTTKEGGMGLGLRICKSIIESCGGRISAENFSNRGARITFSLPVAPT